MPGLIPGGNPGGLMAGQGTAPLGNQLTKPYEATGRATVAAAPVNAGQSTVRNVEGQQRQERSSVESSVFDTAFIAAEEAALEDEPLPLARRAQVRQYFTLLRESIEQTQTP